MQNNGNQVKPFRALHYNPEKIKNIGECLTQPYDVISPEAQENYYNQNPYNFIRLILGKILKEDDESSNRYSRAKETLEKWRKEEVLSLNKEPAFWVYEQEFALPGEEKRRVKGFIGTVKLCDYDEMKILRHEKVLKGPLKDRIDLTKTTNSQFEYIWGVYRDQENQIDQVLENCEKSEPLIDYLEKPFNVRHKLWKLDDPGQCEIIENRMKDLKIYIADGHHRYGTMLQIREDYQKKFPNAPENAPWENILMFLVNSEHEGLTVLPTHRLLHSLDIHSWDSIVSSLNNYFEVKEFSFDVDNEKKIKEDWLNYLASESKRPFGLAIRAHKTLYALSLRDFNAYDSLLNSDYSKEWKMLDVNIVNNLLLKEVLGISEEQLAANSHVKYIVDVNEGLNKLNSEEMDAFVVLNKTPFQAVINVSDRKEMMPRKSTYFFPKPVSGLVMYSMDTADL